MSLAQCVISRKLGVWVWVIAAWSCDIASATLMVQEQHLGAAGGTSYKAGSNRVAVQLTVRDPVVFRVEKQSSGHMPSRVTIADAVLVRSMPQGITVATRASGTGSGSTLKEATQPSPSGMQWDLGLYIDGYRTEFHGLAQVVGNLEFAIPASAERVELVVTGPLTLYVPAGHHGDYTATLQVTGVASE